MTFEEMVKRINEAKFKEDLPRHINYYDSNWTEDEKDEILQLYLIAKRYLPSNEEL